MFDISAIVEAVVTLLALIITGYIIPLLKERLSAENRAKVVNYTEIGVKAAEQMYKKGFINKDERRTYVLNFLKKYNVRLDTVDGIDEIIESIVLTLPHSLVDKKEEKDE